MAVYKSTHCYPFLNSVDIRVGQYGTPSEVGPAQYIKCKVDTSNKKITGYKIRLLDADNSVVFPNGTTVINNETFFDGVISPISELQGVDVEDDDPLINSGINGTYLKIPVFQNHRKPKNYSLNCLYYDVAFAVDYFITDETYDTKYNLHFRQGGAIKEDFNGNAYENWTPTGDSDYPYQWDSADQIFMDQEPLMDGQYVYIAKSQSGGAEDLRQICRVVKTEGSGSNDYIIKLKLEYTNVGASSNPGFMDGSDEVIARKGKTLKDTVWGNMGILPSSTAKDKWIFYNTNNSSASKNYATIDGDGSLYKWEVTLYQGDGETLTSTASWDSHLGTVSFQHLLYTNSGEEIFDVVQTSGTILGSNSKRIQIASEYPFTKLNGVNWGLNGAASLPGWKEGTIVLQTRYMDLMAVATGDTPPDIFDGTRLYVQTYDATYGHVYPATDTLKASVIETATHAQFFKHSNDPSQILDTDIVELGSALNLPFRWWIMTAAADGTYIMNTTSYGDDTETNYNNWKGQSINTRVIGISSEENLSDLTSSPVNLPTSLVSSIQDGSKILLTGQGRQDGNNFTVLNERNGIYVAYKVRAHAETDQGTMKTYWLVKRAASYTTWGNYLGRILYVSNYAYKNSSNETVISGQNVECLANAGGTLWNPLDNVPGDSPLLFTLELPILLFGNLIKSNFDLICDDNTINVSLPPAKVDGEIPKTGMIVFGSKQRKVYKVNGSTWQEITNTYEKISVGNLIYAKSGLTRGKRAWRVQENSVLAAWEPFTAKVLKNTENYTFISPFVGVSRGMRMFFSGGKEVSLGPIKYNCDVLKTGTSWVGVERIDGIPKFNGMKVFCPDEKKFYTISYNTPVQLEWTVQEGDFVYIESGDSYGGNSYKITEVGSDYYLYEIASTNNLLIKNVSEPFYCVLHAPLASPSVSEESSIDKTPWKYEIRSNFKASDVNPFYLYDSPYLILRRDGIDYSDLTNLTITEEFWSLIAGSENYDVFNTQGNEILIVGIYGDDKDVPENKIILSGEYVGTEDLEWESYRWRLYNSDYELLQDTGDKYNKLIQTTFYGITDSKEYYVVLNVKDTKQNSLYYILKVRGKEGDACTVSGDDNTSYRFTSTFVQDMGAVNLTAQNLGNIKDFTILRREYDILTNKNNEFQEFKGEWMPVCINKTPKEDNTFDFWDFNIGNNKRYQYIMFPNYKEGHIPHNYENWFMQLMSNAYGDYQAWFDNSFGEITAADSNTKGASLKACWDWWNIVELIPQDGDEYVPFEEKKYKVNPEQIWSFKYSLETGGQTQNIARSEIQNLGQFPKIGYGKQNYISGEVSALLGNEIFSHNGGYVERTRQSRVSPMTSNEKEKALQQWRKMVNSKNPKLLRDIKGQCWIVQIMGNSNTPKNFYLNQPDTINFQWKQIGSCDGVSITLENNNQILAEIENKEELWRSVFSKL